MADREPLVCARGSARPRHLCGRVRACVPKTELFFRRQEHLSVIRLDPSLTRRLMRVRAYRWSVEARDLPPTKGYSCRILLPRMEWGLPYRTVCVHVAHGVYSHSETKQTNSSQARRRTCRPRPSILS